MNEYLALSWYSYIVSLYAFRSRSVAIQLTGPQIRKLLQFGYL